MFSLFFFSIVLRHRREKERTLCLRNGGLALDARRGSGSNGAADELSSVWQPWKWTEIACMLDDARWLVGSNGEQSRRPAGPSVCDWQWRMTRRVRQIQNQMRVDKCRGHRLFPCLTVLCCAVEGTGINPSTHTHFKNP